MRLRRDTERFIQSGDVAELEQVDRDDIVAGSSKPSQAPLGTDKASRARTANLIDHRTYKRCCVP